MSTVASRAVIESTVAQPRAARVVLSHPGTGPFVQHAARALHEAGLLAAYVTTFHYDRRSALGRLLRTAMGAVTRDAEQQLSRRAITEVPREVVESHPLPEMIRMAAVKGTNPIMTDRVWEVTEKWFDRVVARHHLDGSDAVYGYEHAVLTTFEAQKRRGGLCLYEMPITHHATTARCLEEEFARFPEVETARDRHLRRLAPRRNQRKECELALADLVVCNSSFTRDSLLKAGVASEKIAMVPLGAPPVWDAPRLLSSAPFIFLSAGTQSVRKGTHYLIEAWRKLRPGAGAELWLVGSLTLPAELTANLPGTVVIRPSMPRGQLFELYRRAGALVFPSLCEGFGMVITEAMSQGLPVITTASTAGPDFIEHGRSGFLVPIRDSDSLAETMQWCLDHRDAMPEISRAAAERAARWQWSDYRWALGAAISRFLAEQVVHGTPGAAETKRG
jgi:glycosyltransferase involved in cell wall biosynthesis